MIVPPPGDGDGDDDGDGGKISEVNCVAFHPMSFGAAATTAPPGGHDDDDEEGAAAAQSTTTTTTATFRRDNDCTVYVATSNRVYGYDLRRHASAATSSSSSPSPSPTILRTPHVDLTRAFGCTDEINELSFSHHLGKKRGGSGRRLLLSTVDDSGEARVVEDPPWRFDDDDDDDGGRGGGGPHPAAAAAVVLRHADAGSMAIASCGAFRPRRGGGGGGGKKKRNNNDAAASHLATAGTDCAVKLWDVGAGNGGGGRGGARRRPASAVGVGPRPAGGGDSSPAARLWNPPYVHSLSWSPSGRLLAAGVGDGSVALMRAEGHRLVEVARFGSEGGGHASAVAAVRFPCFGRSAPTSDDDDDDDDDDDGGGHDGRTAAAAPKADRRREKMGGGEGDAEEEEEEDRLLISAGNDGNLIFWDLGSDVAGCGGGDDRPPHPRSYLGRLSSSSSAPPPEGGGDGGGPAAMRRHSRKSSPRVLFRIAHGRKPNWIACGRSCDDALPSSVFVADTTNDVSVYTLPM
jgi:WD40 repeat protein